MISGLTRADVRNFSDGALMYARGSLDKQCHDTADDIERAEQKFAQLRKDRDRVLEELKRRGLTH